MSTFDISECQFPDCNLFVLYKTHMIALLQYCVTDPEYELMFPLNFTVLWNQNWLRSPWPIWRCRCLIFSRWWLLQLMEWMYKGVLSCVTYSLHYLHVAEWKIVAPGCFVISHPYGLCVPVKIVAHLCQLLINCTIAVIYQMFPASCHLGSTNSIHLRV